MPKIRLCRCGCKSEIPVGNTLRKWATVDCALKLVAAARAKKERKALSESRKQTRADKARIKTLATLCKEARTIVQKWARLRDSIYGICICCGAPKIEDGAHLFAVGSKYRTARISLNPDLIMGSCAKCNRFVGGGNIEGYHAGILARFGPGKLAELQELKRRADQGADMPLTKLEVVEIKQYYSRLIRNFETERL